MSAILNVGKSNIKKHVACFGNIVFKILQVYFAYQLKLCIENFSK